ncbi:transposase family protein [Rathayibacter iranicus]|uniref:transposase family protein n=1 Tax=Rathayibacter iranicus TaxID=59737 RepID=UPI0019226117
MLSTVPDPRRRRGVRHQIDAILAVGIAAVLAGSRSFIAIGKWAGDASTATLADTSVSRLGADHRNPRSVARSGTSTRTSWTR